MVAVLVPLATIDDGAAVIVLSSRETSLFPPPPPPPPGSVDELQLRVTPIAAIAETTVARRRARLGTAVVSRRYLYKGQAA